MATVSVRYIVDDVDAAIDFYCSQLGFNEVMHPAPAFAMLSHGDLRLVLTAPGGGPGGGQAMPDGIAAGARRLESLPARGRRPRRARRLAAPARAPGFATRSSRESAAGRSWSRTRPAIRSSCFSPRATRRGSAVSCAPTGARFREPFTAASADAGSSA